MESTEKAQANESGDAKQPDAAMPPQVKYRRRTYIVDPRFQWKYTAFIVLVGAGIAAIMGAFLYRAHSENTRLLDIDPRYYVEISRGEQIFLLYLIAFVVIMALALGFWGIVVTHRISGPIYILGRYLGILADGRYPDLRPLRRKDELQEFFNAFADAIAALKAREKAQFRELTTALDVVRKGADGDDQRRKAALDDVAGRIERMRSQILAALGGQDAEGVLVDEDGND
jgi:hypothetical protein